MFSCAIPLHCPAHKHINISWSGTHSFKRGNCAAPAEETIIRQRCPSTLSTSEQSYTVIKTLKKVIAQQLLIHTDHMSEMFQSAYKPQHPTETALFCVCADIKKALDRKNGTALVMIDLPVAFDTIDHHILLHRLRHRYGVFRCCSLTDSCQRVCQNNEYSPIFVLSTGVAQGSVLGPLLFSLYIQPIGDIIRKHGLTFHHYADDLHISAHFECNDQSISVCLERLRICIIDIQEWFKANKLVMNEEKNRYDSLVATSSIRVGVIVFQPLHMLLTLV